MNWYQKLLIASAGRTYINSSEFIKRLQSIGWEVERTATSHWRAVGPSGNREHSIFFNGNELNWNRNVHVTRKKLRKISRDLDFVMSTPFIIPEGFDPMTLEIAGEETESTKPVYLTSLLGTPEEISHYQVNVNGEWERIMDIDDPDYNNNSIVVMTESGGMQEFPVRQPVEMRMLQVA